MDACLLNSFRLALVLALFTIISRGPTLAAPAFRIATYNVENYLDEPTQTRFAKPPEAIARVRQMILVLKPDVIALQEMGSLKALSDLRFALKTNGLDFPFWEHISGADTNVHLAILSQFPFTARRSRTNDNMLVGGRRFRVSRGFGEVDIRVSTNYVFTLITAHLKSRRAIPQAEEAELRLEEAKLLREEIDARLAADPKVNLVVLGDFNDTKDAASTRTVIGRGKFKLVDTRPAERNGDSTPAGAEARRVTWTHYYAKDDSYSRIDYILLSPGMAREWMAEETYILAMPDWGLASDHRPLVATFAAEDR